jgi:hypothetical protein
LNNGGVNGGATSNYKVYRALLNQTGTDDPIPIVLENTLGGIPVWTRASQGYYDGTLANAFPLAKTFHLTENIRHDSGGHLFYWLGWGSINIMSIRTYNFSGLSDGILFYHPVEILVYP